MEQPSKFLTLDVAYGGSPFVTNGPGSSTLLGMDYTFRGSPFINNVKSDGAVAADVTEMAAATDLVQQVVPAGITEAVTAADFSSGNWTAYNTITEAAYAKDASNPATFVSKFNAYAIVGPRNDAVTVTKLAMYAVVGPRNDAVTTSKVVGYVVTDNLLYGLKETANATDATSMTITYGPATVVESAAATETSTGAAQLIADRTEAANATDQSTRAVGTLGDAAETTGADDQTDARMGYVASVVESAVASENVTVRINYAVSVTEAAQAVENFDGVGTIKTGKRTRVDITEKATANTTQTGGRGSLVFQSEVLAAYETIDASVEYALKPVTVVEAAQAADTETQNVATNAAMAENSIAAVVAAASYIGFVQVGNEATPATDQARATYQTRAAMVEAAVPGDTTDSTTQMDRGVLEAAAALDTNDTTVDWSVTGVALAAADDASDTNMDYAVETVEALSADANTIESVDVVPPVYIFEAVAADDIAQASVIVNAEIEEPTDNLTQAMDFSGLLVSLPLVESAAALEHSECAVDYAISMAEFTAAVEQSRSRADYVADQLEAENPDDVSDAIRAAKLFKSKFVTVEFGTAVKRTIATQLIAKRSLNFSGKVVARRVPFTDPT